MALRGRISIAKTMLLMETSSVVFRQLRGFVVLKCGEIHPTQTRIPLYTS